MSELSSSQRRAYQGLVDAVRRYRIDVELLSDEPTTIDELRAWLEPTLARMNERVARGAAEIQSLRALTANVKRGAGGEWKALEDALRKVEADLRSAPTLRMRLDEGRRSLMPKIEAMVHQHLEPKVEVDGRSLRAALHPDGLEALRAELPHWVAGWAQYTFAWLDHDLNRELHIAWTPREADLPVPAPVLTTLVPPEIDSTIDFGDIEVRRDGVKIWSGMARHARSLAYTLMSGAFLIGVQRPTMLHDGGETAPSGVNWVVVLGILGVLFYSWTVAQDERRKTIERLESDLRNKAEQATRDAIRQWLDRWADKLQEHARDALLARRGELITWYRQEVVARRSVMQRKIEADKQRVEQARLELPKRQDAARNLERALVSLNQLAQSMEGA